MKLTSIQISECCPVPWKRTDKPNGLCQVLVLKDGLLLGSEVEYSRTSSFISSLKKGFAGLLVSG